MSAPNLNPERSRFSSRVSLGAMNMPAVCHDAERSASERSASACPECGATSPAPHASVCPLRPRLSYEEYRRWLRANRPEDYWGDPSKYFSDR